MAVMDLETPVHPGLEKLRKLGQGRLAADEVLAMEVRLADCESCCRLLEATPDDSFVERLRDARDQPSVNTLFNRTHTLLTEGEEPGELADHPRYRLIRLLGRGGMGAVYLAHHRHMGRPVALKIINPDLLDQRGALERFRQEARAAAQLDHPNIVAAYDADHAGQVHFLVMEYIEGQNLAHYLSEQGSLPIAQACDIIRQAALGLQHAHECGMIHRDIKPHNLMLTPGGQVKVLDFGLARLAAEPAIAANETDIIGTPHLTGAGAVIGSADYIAPEQARDAHAADCRSDIYSLGCTLYHLLTNQPPFPEGTAPEKLERHNAMDPRCLVTLRPDAPKHLANVVAKMMAKHPDQRYPSAVEVAAALAPLAAPRRRRRFPLRLNALVGVCALCMCLSAALAGVVRLSAGDREIVIETDDPTVEVVVKGDRIVRIVDPKTGKAYQIDRSDLTLSLADEPDGLAVMLDGERPLCLKRQGKQIATVRLEKPARVPTEPPPPPLINSSPAGVVEGTATERSVLLQVTIAWLDVTKSAKGKKPSSSQDQAQPAFGIVKNREGILKDLAELRNKNLAMSVTEPSMKTTSGHSVFINCGGETPIMTSSRRSPAFARRAHKPRCK